MDRVGIIGNWTKSDGGDLPYAIATMTEQMAISVQSNGVVITGVLESVAIIKVNGFYRLAMVISSNDRSFVAPAPYYPSHFYYYGLYDIDARFHKAKIKDERQLDWYMNKWYGADWKEK